MIPYLYVVTWCILTSVPCPDYVEDKFGRYPQTSCLVMHTGCDHHKKTFRNADSATAFYNEGDRATHYGLGGLSGCYDFKLDSVLITQFNN